MSAPPDKGVNTPQEQKEMYYIGTPGFVPRRIVSSKIKGTAGKPVVVPANIPPPEPRVDVATAKADFLSIKPKFATVAALLDKRGQSMTICQNLPPAIAARFLRQKQADESCWAFYKRMIAVAQEFPPTDPNKLNTYSEQLARHGNDILDDPFSNKSVGYPFNGAVEGGGQQRTNNYDEDPGPKNLLMMLFIALLRMIASAIFNLTYGPIQQLLGQTNKLELEKVPNPTTAVAAQASGVVSSVVGGVIDAVGAAFSAISSLLGAIPVVPIAFEIVKNAAFDLIDQIIGTGPKMKRDVTRYDALITSSYIRESSRYSEDQEWPEAAMLYPHYYALTKQNDAGAGVFDYFQNNALSTTRQAANFVGGVASNAAQMPTDLAGVLTLQKDYTGSALDRMNTLLSGQSTDNLFCCLFRFLGSQDLRWLNVAQAVLRLSLNRQAISFETLDSALSNLWHTIEKVILSAIMSTLYNIFDEINSKIKGSLNLQAQSPLFQAGQCASWNIFVGKMLQFIGGIEASVLDLVVNFNRSLQSQDQYQTVFINGLGDNQYIRRLLKLIDIVINAKQFGTLCRNSDVPSDEELRTLFDQVKDQFSLVTNDLAGSSNTGGLSNGSATTEARSQFDKCLSKVPQEQVEQVLAWIKNLVGTTNG